MTGSRDIDSGTATAATAPKITPVLFAKLEFDSGNLLAHTALGEITFGGDTYHGIGNFGGISTADEASDLSRTPITLTLSGVPNDIISLALGEHYQGRRATVYLGYLDLTTRQLAGAPTILYRGNMDSSEIQTGKDSTVSVSVESRFAAWSNPNPRRYNNADQQARYPGDTGLEFVEQAASKNLAWGGPG